MIHMPGLQGKDLIDAVQSQHVWRSVFVLEISSNKGACAKPMSDCSMPVFQPVFQEVHVDYCTSGQLSPIRRSEG